VALLLFGQRKGDLGAPWPAPSMPDRNPCAHAPLPDRHRDVLSSINL